MKLYVSEVYIRVCVSALANIIKCIFIISLWSNYILFYLRDAQLTRFDWDSFERVHERLLVHTNTWVKEEI